MIESVINTPVTLTSNSSNVIFTDDYRSRSANCSCNGWLSHNNGSPLYKILKGGSYIFDLSITATSGTAGIVAFGLYEDGILIPSTVVAETIGVAGDLINVSFNKKISVCCNSGATLTIASVPIVNAGVTGDVATATQTPIITNGIFGIERKS